MIVRALRRPEGLIAAVFLLALIVVAALAPAVLADAADTMSPVANAAPSLQHVLGTDAFGRDLLARTLVAAHTTLILAACAASIALALGGGIALATQLAPVRVRRICERALDLAVVYPALLLALVVAAAFGAGSFSIVLAVGIGNAPAFARLVLVVSGGLLRTDYVVAARVAAVPSWRIGLRHLLPNSAEPLLIVSGQLAAGVLVELAGLSFLGYGPQPPTYDWGRMLTDALPAVYTRPTQVLGPAIAIVATCTAILTLSDQLARASDPRERRALPHRAASRRRPSNTSSVERSPIGRAARALQPVESPLPTDLVARMRGLAVDDARGRALLHHVDLDVRSGERLVIVGPSGSGKSLTIGALSSALPVGVRRRAGSVQVREPARVSTVLQNPAACFSPLLSIRAQVRDALRRSVTGRQAIERWVVAAEALGLHDARRVLAARPWQLSGGMMQRVLMAIALAGQPRLLVADEPTSALDAAAVERTLAELEAIHTRLGCALVVVTHDIAVAERLAERVVVLDGGRVVEQLTGDELRRGRARHPLTRALLAAKVQRLGAAAFRTAFAVPPADTGFATADRLLAGSWQEAA